MADKKEMTKEEKETLLKRAKAAGIGTSIVSGISGVAAYAGKRAQKNPGLNRYNPISNKTVRGLKGAAIVGLPAGMALAGYSSYKLKKLKKEDGDSKK